jgi:hypothetical protein
MTQYRLAFFEVGGHFSLVQSRFYEMYVYFQGMFRGHNGFQKPFPLFNTEAVDVKGRTTRKYYAKRKQFFG